MFYFIIILVTISNLNIYKTTVKMCDKSVYSIFSCGLNCTYSILLQLCFSVKLKVEEVYYLL